MHNEIAEVTAMGCRGGQNNTWIQTRTTWTHGV